MRREDWQKADRIFQSALGLDVGRRAAFIEEACGGDVTIKREVDKLLTTPCRFDHGAVTVRVKLTDKVPAVAVTVNVPALPLAVRTGEVA